MRADTVANALGWASVIVIVLTIILLGLSLGLETENYTTTWRIVVPVLPFLCSSAAVVILAIGARHNWFDLEINKYTKIGP